MSLKGPILLVEDDADDQFIFQEILNRLEIKNKLILFSKGEAVLNFLRTTTEKPFIIFCDINMPEMDGLEVRRQINDEEALRRKSIPFVFFSTAATQKQVMLAYDMTVQGFFLKGQTVADTQETIKLIVDYWRKCQHLPPEKYLL